MKMKHFETLNIWRATQNKKLSFDEARESTHDVIWQGIVAALLDLQLSVSIIWMGRSSWMYIR